MAQDYQVKCQVQSWQVRTLDNGQTVRTIAHEDDEKDGQDPNDKYALVVEKTFDKQDSLVTTTLEVNSRYILSVFRNVIGEHPSVSSDFSGTITLKSPFQMLIHHWSDLEDHLKNTEDDETRMHLSLLLQWMEGELGTLKRKIDAEHRSGFCHFDSLWVLFKPGDTAISFEKTHAWLLRVDKTVYEENKACGKYMEVHCSYTDHDGVHSGTADHTFVIKQKSHFGQDNPATIRSLEVYPRTYHKLGQELEDQLRDRGLRFLELSKRMSVRRYDGLALFAKTPPPGYFNPNAGEDAKVWSVYTETGRVIVDQKTYRQEHTATKVNKKAELDSVDIIRFPPSVYGYSCSVKMWCRFFLPDIRDPGWKKAPFDDLVLRDGAKNLIQALVSSHVFPENARDQTLQKGKGLVCLLYGPPGSGKTFTAESAAEMTHRALLSCSLSELNKYNSPHYFEANIARILRLATTWKAVVLLDEADVFLEARQDQSPSNVDRHALVAIFLRQLEYFSGVIFLTTNRVHVFDAAMKSRVHLAIEYEAPGREARRTLWRNRLSTVTDGPSGEELEAMLDYLEAMDELNGREIANAVMTASTLARYRSEPLQRKHFETILDAHKAFTDRLRLMERPICVLNPSTEHVSST